jgi:phage baseplate assembly protein W
MFNEQDSSEDIIDCVKAIVAYPTGSRQNMRDFGIPDLLFKQTSGQIPDLIKNAVSTWEERASFNVTGGPAIDDELLWEILLKVISRDA